MNPPAGPEQCGIRMDSVSLATATVTFEYNSNTQGYHAYQAVRTPLLGEILPCSPEDGN